MIIIPCIFLFFIFVYVFLPGIISYNCHVEYNTFDTRESSWLFHLEANSQWFPEGVIGNNITGYPYFIVPNIIHYVLIDDNQISFVHYLSFKSVFSVQNPDKIMIHCNCDEIRGQFWMKLKSDNKNFEDKVMVRRVEKHESVFGIPYSRSSHIWHLSDILRNKVLMEFGGIYLDRDVVIIKSLDPFRKFEITLDYEFEKTFKVLGTQVQIAHKRARFLRLYLQTYKKYDGSQWYWNAGAYPTERIIDRYPHLVHSLNGEFGLSGGQMCAILYLDNLNNWREKYFTIHLLMRGNSIEHTLNWCFKNSRIPSIIYFDEESVKTLKTTFGQIARHILYNNTDIIND